MEIYTLFLQTQHSNLGLTLTKIIEYRSFVMPPPSLYGVPKHVKNYAVRPPNTLACYIAYYHRVTAPTISSESNFVRVTNRDPFMRRNNISFPTRPASLPVVSSAICQNGGSVEGDVPDSSPHIKRRPHNCYDSICRRKTSRTHFA